MTEKDVFSNHILQFLFPLTFSKDRTVFTFILLTVRNRPSGSCQESVFFHPETISLFRAMFPDSLGFLSKHWTRNCEDKMKSAEFQPFQVTAGKQTLICPPAKLYLSFVPGFYPKERSFLAPIIAQIQNLEWFGDPRGGGTVCLRVVHLLCLNFAF